MRHSDISFWGVGFIYFYLFIYTGLPLQLVKLLPVWVLLKVKNDDELLRIKIAASL